MVGRTPITVNASASENIFFMSLSPIAEQLQSILPVWRRCGLPKLFSAIFNEVFNAGTTACLAALSHVSFVSDS